MSLFAAATARPSKRGFSGIRPLALAAIVAIVAAVTACAGAAQAQVPTIDIEDTCRIAANAMVRLMGGSSPEADKQACLNSEQRAREGIVKDWGTFSAADRSLCLLTEVYLPSYVEWLTCLEMNRDVRKLGAAGARNEMTVVLPIVRPKVLY